MKGDSVVPALQIKDLWVEVTDDLGHPVPVLSGVDLSVPQGAAVGLVGESGSGKSMTASAVLGLMPRGARITRGEILFHGEDLLTKSPREMNRLRGRELCMVTQDPMTSLDPSFTLQSQLVETLERARPEVRQAPGGLRAAAVQALRSVRIPSPETRATQYPHQLSGGMRQRVASALALAGEPSLLLADEPTTALDVTTQAYYLQLLARLRASRNFGMLFITHDLLLMRQLCERVVVMYAGQVVETGPTDEVLTSPQHPYTQALFAAVPKIGHRERAQTIAGAAPAWNAMPAGCHFGPRCPSRRDLCDTAPALATRGADRAARCWGTEDQGWVHDVSS